LSRLIKLLLKPPIFSRSPDSELQRGNWKPGGVQDKGGHFRKQLTEWQTCLKIAKERTQVLMRKRS